MKLVRAILYAMLTFCAAATTERASGASSVEYSATGSRILTFVGTPAPTGDYVAIGTFSSGFNFAASSTNYTVTSAAFTPYGNTTIGSGGYNAGQFSAQTGNLDSTTAAGKQLYLWLFNSATPSSATGWAIVSDTASNWIGPAVGSTAATQLDASDPGVYVPSGALGSIVNDSNAPSGMSVEMGVAPEPSTYVLSSLACLVFIGSHSKKLTIPNFDKQRSYFKE